MPDAVPPDHDGDGPTRDEPDELARRRDMHDRQRQLVVASLLACPPVSRSA